MTDVPASPFVSTEWLFANLGRNDLTIVDASWHLPGAGRDARTEYIKNHIAGAVFFDIDAVADHDSNLPHMLPPPDAFAEAVGAMGISEDMTIVVYDETGLFSATRAWWTFSVMGARDVRILSGGGPRWRAKSLPLEKGWPSPARRRFTSAFDRARVARFDQVAGAVRDSTQILDARPAARFRGDVPEPRPHLKSGHIPTSRNLPASDLVANGELLAPSALREALAATGIDLDRPVITTCGSGVTAATLALALEIVGARNVALYDGSWAEWGAHPEAEIATTST